VPLCAAVFFYPFLRLIRLVGRWCAKLRRRQNERNAESRLCVCRRGAARGGFFILMPKEPRDEQRWRGARYSDVRFVHADTQHQAREQAARAFGVAGEESRNPWLDLSTCVCSEAAMLGDRPPDEQLRTVDPACETLADWLMPPGALGIDCWAVELGGSQRRSARYGSAIRIAKLERFNSHRLVDGWV
jgi:hypothetical protein